MSRGIDGSPAAGTFKNLYPMHPVGPIAQEFAPAQVNHSSGHDQPSSPSAQAAAERAFGDAGLDASGKYMGLPF